MEAVIGGNRSEEWVQGKGIIKEECMWFKVVFVIITPTLILF